MQQLTVDYVAQAGGYVGPPVRKEISWISSDGKKHEAYVYVKLASYDKVITEFLSQKEGADYFVSRIVSSICDEKGNPVFTAKDVQGDENGDKRMCSSLFLALLGAINDANRIDEEEIKN